MKLCLLFLLLPFTVLRSQPVQHTKYVVVPPEGGMKLGSGAWKLTADNTGGSLALCEFKNKDTTDWNWVPNHAHTREDEIWYVLEGELTFRINNQLITAGPGSTVFGPRNTMHAYRISRAPARYLLMLTPAGIDRLFLEVDSIGKRFPRGSSEFFKRVAPLSAKYGSYHQPQWDSIMNKKY
jgi:mannose-6-phosphate isomerase-like protein (cupin superfamily)